MRKHFEMKIVFDSDESFFNTSDGIKEMMTDIDSSEAASCIKKDILDHNGSNVSVIYQLTDVIE